MPPTKARPVPSSAPVVNTERASQQYYIDCLNLVLERLGWQNVGGPPTPGTAVVWSEDPARRPRLLALPAGTRTNRFFGMVRVCRKVCLAVCIDACARLHPDDFDGLAPSSWWVGRAGVGWEGQLEAHRAHVAAEKRQRGGAAGGGGEHGGGGPSPGGSGGGSAAKAAAADGGACGGEDDTSQAFIVKPDNGCQGAGISLVRGHAELRALLASADGPERAVVQAYLPNPLLIDGRKFDLRLYVVRPTPWPSPYTLHLHPDPTPRP
jgi:hypothetical protein